MSQLEPQHPPAPLGADDYSAPRRRRRFANFFGIKIANFRCERENLAAEPMSFPSKKPVAKPLIAAYTCLCVCMALVFLLGVWGAYRDLRLIRSTLLTAEISTLRSKATHRAGHLEGELQREVQVGEPIDWTQLRDSDWLERYWQIVRRKKQDEKLYAALVDPLGRVVLHTDSAIENRLLGRRWYDRVVSEVGDDVVQTRGDIMTGGQPVFDIRVPIEIDGREVASYHEGTSVAWIEKQLTSLRGQILWRWLLVIGGIVVLVVLSFTSLLYIARRKSLIERAADAAELRRVSEIGQLAAGLAHEIRNPLHAIRLNLHSFRRTQNGDVQIDKQEIAEMIDQSAREIDRLEHLMNDLLGFASPKKARDEVVDLKAELETTLDFIEQELLHKKLHVETEFPEHPVRIQMDSGRLRQVVLNLLVNAQDALDEGGEIRVTLRRRGAKAEITVADSGSGICESDRGRLFEPFFSTKDNGTGLGLALVKRFVEEAGGTVGCVSNGTTGATFRITLPLSASAK